MTDNNNDVFKIHGLFPIPVYQAQRELDLDLTEKKEIEGIIEEGTHFNALHSFSNNSYIFNTKLKKLKEFCEQHIKIYVKEIINPKEELDVYITQSWLNVIKPGESHQNHAHANSIISGAFYIQTDVGQTITCYAMQKHTQPTIQFMDQTVPTLWNSDVCSFNVINNQFLLFPSWLVHGVQVNEKQTKDVISLSFNTFVRGKVGHRANLDQLILQ
jgi:uncharacterized protein (TIGR02466 family)